MKNATEVHPLTSKCDKAAVHAGETQVCIIQEPIKLLQTCSYIRHMHVHTAFYRVILSIILEADKIYVLHKQKLATRVGTIVNQLHSRDIYILQF